MKFVLTMMKFVFIMSNWLQAEAKALILASVFLIDFMFFENPQDNSQHRHNNDW